MSSDVSIKNSFQSIHPMYQMIIDYCIDTDFEIQRIFEEMRLQQAFLAFQKDPTNKASPCYVKAESLYAKFKETVQNIGPDVLYFLLENKIDGRVIGFVASIDKPLMYKPSDNDVFVNALEATFQNQNPMALECLLRCETEQKERSALVSRLQSKLAFFHSDEEISEDIVIQIAKVLLRHGADKNASPSEEYGCCCLPALTGNFVVLDLFLNEGMNPNFERDRFTLLGDLMTGFQSDHQFEKCSDRLFEAGVKVSLVKPICLRQLESYPQQLQIKYTMHHEFCYGIFRKGMDREPDQAVKILFTAAESGLDTDFLGQLIEVCPQITCETQGGTKNKKLVEYYDVVPPYLKEALHIRESLTQLERWKKELSAALHEGPQKGVKVIFEAAKSGLHYEILASLIMQCPPFNRGSRNEDNLPITNFYESTYEKNELDKVIKIREDHTIRERIKDSLDQHTFPPDFEYC